MKLTKILAAAALGTGLLASAAYADGHGGTIVGVSWSNFQEERWKTDEAAIKSALEAAGATYISAARQCPAQHGADPDRAGQHGRRGHRLE